MIPSLFRRCPSCGRLHWRRRFATVRTDDGRRMAECPDCGCLIETTSEPWLT